MAYLQVNRDGTEWISSEPLIRYPFTIKVGRRNIQCSIEQQDRWTWPYMVAENLGEIVELPTGTIERIIGRTLTFEDEPYQF
jgi:hypothetical protein